MKSSCLSYETSCPEVTKFTLEKDQSLATYIGMKGEANRKKLADLFKRPIAFKEYCGLSASRCSESDNVASRPPNSDGSEDEKYFIEGVFIGDIFSTLMRMTAKRIQPALATLQISRVVGKVTFITKSNIST